MIKVNNRKVITNLSWKSFRANKLRNRTAIIAIMLTTILFTSVLTIMGTILKSIEQQEFRMYGGAEHGCFKRLTEEELQELSGDGLITSYCTRCFLGGPLDAPFHKCSVEISYMDEKSTDTFSCTPTVGRLPKEGTKEILCDKNVLDLLGIEAKIGAEVPITYYVGKSYNECNKVTDTFTLCGWFEHDSVSPANFVNVPLSYAKEVNEQKKDCIEDETIGTYKQAGYLCVWGIPLGLLIGYVVGVSLGDMAVGLTSCNQAVASRNPLIFLGAVVFSVITVFLSCRRPARMAGKIAPVEAVKYAEGKQSHKQGKKKTHKNTISNMAWANLGRNKKKTVLVVLSMTLGIVLFESIYMFVHGFDMNRFVSEFSVCDFHIASANYYEPGRGYRFPEDSLEEDDIKAIESENEFEKSG